MLRFRFVLAAALAALVISPAFAAGPAGKPAQSLRADLNVIAGLLS